MGLIRKIFIVPDAHRAQQLFLSKKELAGPALLVLVTDREQAAAILDICRIKKAVNVCDRPLAETERFLAEYIDLIGDVNSKYQSIKWWSYSLSSKDYVSSSFFDELYRTICLAKKIKCSGAEPIVVVADSPRVARQLKYLCEKDNKRVILFGFRSWLCVLLFSLSRQMFSSALFLLKQYYRIIVCSMFLHRRKLFGSKMNGGKRYVIRSWATIVSLSSSPYQDLYFGSLENDLKSKRLNVEMLVGVLGDFIAAVKLMRADGRPLPQEILLRLIDPILALFYCRLKPCKIKGPVYFQDIDVFLLLNSCLAYERSCGQDLHNMLYYCLGKRLARHYRPDTCIFSHENYPWEKMLILGLRATAKPFIIGYQHSVLYQALTSVLLGRNEKDFIPLPDRIVTVGNITRDYLVKEGHYPPARLRSGCSLSAVKLGPVIKSRSMSKNLLVVLGCYPRAKEMLEFVISSLKKSDFQLIIRPHPAAPLAGYIDSLAFDLKALKNIEISSSPLAKDLERSFAVLYDGSKVALEAMGVGLPVIKISHFHDIISYDPLINFPLNKLKAGSEKSLVTLLNEIALKGENEDQKIKAQRYYREYLGQKGEECFSLFLR
ncbi:MAG: hypothetical protein WCW67_02050 [Candidatus Margulisiibacteriota bacterium]|jgi:hypothetical protein